MKKLYQTWPFNFGAVHKQDFQKAKVIILPVPYEATTSFNSGTKEGPYKIIENSRHLDELLDSHGSLVGLKSTDIYTIDEIELSKNSPQEAIEGIRQAVFEEAVVKNKIPFMLGGEHTITLGGVRAVKEKYPDVSVLQIDAHTDLIDEFEFTKYSHACVMRRIKEMGVPIIQVGIRNFNAEVLAYIKKEKIKTIYPSPKIPVDKILKDLGKNVYLTFDLDGLDPSIMPSVGTPEPGGLGWYEVLGLIEEVGREKNIVGADLVELLPIPGLNAPDFLAAKLAYQMVCAMVCS